MKSAFGSRIRESFLLAARTHHLQDKWIGNRTWVSKFSQNYNIASVTKSIVNKVLPGIVLENFKLHYTKKNRIADYKDHKTVLAYFYFISTTNKPPVLYKLNLN